jgi:hypothetical protein
VTEPLTLTELRDEPGRGTVRYWARAVRRSVRTARALLSVLPKDLARSLRSASSLMRMEEGRMPGADLTRIALYVHYSVTGQVSAMVRVQLALLRQAGFGIVFISMAQRIPEDDWQAVRTLCALVVQRENFGLDFGAWHDLMPEVRRRWPALEELMLVNDSVLGPINPLAPVIDVMRAGGEGLFGLTENIEGGVHLQSYMLLARGRDAIADLKGFVRRMRITHSKWLLIERGEIRLARWMQRRGHRVAAVFGYNRLVRAVAADPAERRRIAASHLRLAELDRVTDEQVVALLHTWPLSPMHHMWHILATRFGGPFLKTELVLRNPLRLSGVGDWPTVVPQDAPCDVAMIRAHLRTVSPVTGPVAGEPLAQKEP